MVCKLFMKLVDLEGVIALNKQSSGILDSYLDKVVALRRGHVQQDQMKR